MKKVLELIYLLVVVIMFTVAVPSNLQAADKLSSCEISLMSRSGWKAESAVTSLLKEHKNNEIKYITIHHTESSVKRGIAKKS